MDFQLSLESERITSAHPEPPLAATPETPVSVAIGLLSAQQSGAVLVCGSDSKLLGIFTERDALKLMSAAAAGDTALLSKTLGDVMSPDLTVATTDTTVGEAIRVMHAGGYRHLPIVDGSQTPTGSVAVQGIVHYLVEHFPETIYNLPPKADQAPAEREGA